MDGIGLFYVRVFFGYIGVSWRFLLLGKWIRCMWCCWVGMMVCWIFCVWGCFSFWYGRCVMVCFGL